MAGIEDAFKKFVTRVSSQEEPQDEYGDPQTGEKRIPLMQGLKRGYDFENTMPIYQDDRYNIPQQELAYGGRAGYAFGGIMKQALSQIGDQLAEKLPPEQQEAIVKANLNEGGIGGIFRNIISRVRDVVSNVVKGSSTATPAAGLAIQLDRPLQPGDPIGSYYVDPNMSPLSIASSKNVVPPATNQLTRPLGMAGFYGSEISEILKRLGYTFADGGVASMFRERPGYQVGGNINPFDPMQRPDDLGLPGEENLTEETLEEAMARGVIFYDPITGRQINRVGTREVGFDPNFITQRAMQAQQDAAARTLPINIPSVATPSNFLSPYQSMQQEILTRLQSIPIGGATQSVSEGSSGINPIFRINRAIQAEQDAAARVMPTRMADGGRVSMSEGGLTTTVPPVSGPDPQGVESLFRRRYS